MRQWILRNIAQKTVDGMRSEGTPFKGILFIGLMMTHRGPMVLEFNTRFGDPETEAILLRLETDIVDLFNASIDGAAHGLHVRMKPGASACVIAASAGLPWQIHLWPSDPRHGRRRSEHRNTNDVVVFHSGTAVKDGQIVTAGRPRPSRLRRRRRSPDRIRSNLCAPQNNLVRRHAIPPRHRLPRIETGAIMSEPVLTAQEVLKWNEATSNYWRKFLADNPAILAIPCDIASTKTVAELLHHIVAVELRWAERIARIPETPFEQVSQDSIEALYATHDKAIALLKQTLPPTPIGTRPSSSPRAPTEPCAARSKPSTFTEPCTASVTTRSSAHWSANTATNPPGWATT